MKPKSLLQYSRKHATEPYVDPDKSIHTLTRYSFKINFNNTSHLRLSLKSSLPI
jgi:hypothetical protein